MSQGPQRQPPQAKILQFRPRDPDPEPATSARAPAVEEPASAVPQVVPPQVVPPRGMPADPRHQQKSRHAAQRADQCAPRCQVLFFTGVRYTRGEALEPVGQSAELMPAE